MRFSTFLVSTMAVSVLAAGSLEIGRLAKATPPDTGWGNSHAATSGHFVVGGADHPRDDTGWG